MAFWVVDALMRLSRTINCMERFWQVGLCFAYFSQLALVLKSQVIIFVNKSSFRRRQIFIFFFISTTRWIKRDKICHVAEESKDSSNEH